MDLLRITIQSPAAPSAFDPMLPAVRMRPLSVDEVPDNAFSPRASFASTLSPHQLKVSSILWAPPRTGKTTPLTSMHSRQWEKIRRAFRSVVR